MKQFWGVVVAGWLVVACGGAPAKRPEITQAALAGQAPRLRELLRGSVFNGGLRFDDAACAAAFGAPGKVDAARFDEFARCLAALGLQPSARKDSLADVLVMQHEPGFEVQARVVQDRDGPRLTWIGFASRFEGDPAVPTITHAAFEQLRLSGDRNGPVDPTIGATLELGDTGAGRRAAYTWFKVCLDATGVVTNAEPMTTTGVKAERAFADAVATWKFRSFTVRGEPVAVCALVRPAYPADSAPAVETLPLPPPPSQKRPLVLASPELIEGKRVAGTRTIFPDDIDKEAIRESGVERIIGSFRVCLDETGVVESVLPLRSTTFARYDTKLMKGIWQWRYSPYLVDDQPVPVCTGITFIYGQR